MISLWNCPFWWIVPSCLRPWQVTEEIQHAQIMQSMSQLRAAIDMYEARDIMLQRRIEGFIKEQEKHVATKNIPMLRNVIKRKKLDYAFLTQLQSRRETLECQIRVLENVKLNSVTVSTLQESLEVMQGISGKDGGDLTAVDEIMGSLERENEYVRDMADCLSPINGMHRN